MPPRLVLSTRSLDLPGRATRDRALETASRFRESESLAVALVKAGAAGAEAVYGPPSTALRAALAELRQRVPVLPRLPLLPAALDLFDDHPLMLEGGERGGGEFAFGAAATRVALLPAALSGDLAPRIIGRLDDGAGLVPARARIGVVVAHEVTDLLLAAGHARGVERVLRHARSRFGLAGFETGNPGTLLARLHDWGLEPDFVVAPVNPRGLGMRPDLPFTLAQMGRAGVRVLATELTAAGAVELREGARFALARGAWGLVPDVADLDDLSGELRQLAALRDA
jgi:hypothetical protein